MAKCIEKITKEQFSYDKKATWDRVKLCEISLPITSDGGINFDYMVRYIHAIEKLAIADVVKYNSNNQAGCRDVRITESPSFYFIKVVNYKQTKDAKKEASNCPLYAIEYR